LLAASSGTEARYGDNAQELAVAEDHRLAAAPVLLVELDVAGILFADMM
jgi:hypothetical protein